MFFEKLLIYSFVDGWYYSLAIFFVTILQVLINNFEIKKFSEIIKMDKPFTHIDFSFAITIKFYILLFYRNDIYIKTYENSNSKFSNRIITLPS